MAQTDPAGTAPPASSAGTAATGLPLAPARVLFDAIPANAAQIDASGRIVAVNRAWKDWYSGNRTDLPSTDPGADYFVVCEHLTTDQGTGAPSVGDLLREILAGTRDVASFVYLSPSRPEKRWFRAVFSPIEVDGARGALILSFDITREKLAQQQLFELAYFDRLTGLPSHLLISDRLRKSLCLGRRENKGVAVLLLDIDRYKFINETYGNHIGDVLLQAIGHRIEMTLRKSDSTGRIGGDQFVVIAAHLENGAEAAVVARKLLTELEKPFLIEDQEIHITTSIGIALQPDDGDDAESLLRLAEAAMHQAKELERGGHLFYRESLNDGALERLKQDADLRQALARGQFELFYQPKISCSNGEIVGMEALIRWRHPTRGLVSPGDFIPILEKIGLIGSVGEWALGEACTQLKRWIDRGLGKASVAVNLSAHQFNGNGLVDVVRNALAVSALPAERLELELTESTLMHNVEQVITTLSALRHMGIHISVDDFGTGYSSLSYLKRFPLDSVKIDRSFIEDITADPDDASITRAVITMAHSLKMKVIAEGVETEGQLSLLIANHCDEIQGYYFSPPVPAAEMERILADRNSIPPLPPRTAGRERTLLLVDDEENILASLRRLLRRCGYRILTASSGAAGLELLAQNRVDVIVSDQRMPGMTGVEFLRRVKTIHPHTVRMVLSGYTELQSITDAINEGAIYKFLTKPWDDDLLRANIEEAFSYKELADENRRLNAEVLTANKELAMANARLQETLIEKEERLSINETTLDVAQEVLHWVPFPILGFDDGGLVVFANQEAERIFGAGGSLLGLEAESCLAPPLARLIGSPDAEPLDWDSGATRWHVVCRRLGMASGGHGRLLTLLSLRA